MSWMRSFWKSGSIGAVGTALHFAVLTVSVERFDVSVVVASSCGAVVGAATNYWLNQRYNYKGVSPHRRAAPLFLLVAVFGFLLNAACMEILVSLLNCQYLLAQVITTCGVFLFKFFINHTVTFSGPPMRTPTPPSFR